ncbi:univin-like [Aplysia californica]|uniref:Univin-like n=1 Tax=Aplysia californica TaxID=6500 RepID=A0ABM1W017_APLCA|nr:univin-like [Aplysia californica]
MTQALIRHRSTLTTSSHFLVLLLSSFLPCLLLLLAPVCHVSHAKALPALPQPKTTNCSRSGSVLTETGTEKDADVRSQEHEAVVEELKSKILSKLSFAQGLPSNTTVNKMSQMSTREVREKIKEFMKRVRREQVERGEIESETHPDDEEEEDNVKSTLYYSAEPSNQVFVQKVDSGSEPQPLSITTFHTKLKHPAEPYHELLIKSAILRMRLQHQRTSLQQGGVNTLKSPLNVSMYWLQHEDSSNHNTEHSSSKKRLLKSFTIHGTNVQTLTLDVESLLSSSIADFEDSHRPIRIGVTVQEMGSSSSDAKDKHSISAQQQQQPSQQHHTVDIAASLEVTSRTRNLRRLSRGRRDTARRECSNSLCCRHQVYISFSDIGWDDWVVAPEGYNAYFCKGDCPLRYKSSSTFSQIKSLLHAKNHNLIPSPVCAATGYSSLPVLYYDDFGALQDTDYADMLVTGCRCN